MTLESAYAVRTTILLMESKQFQDLQQSYSTKQPKAKAGINGNLSDT